MKKKYFQSLLALMAFLSGIKATAQMCPPITYDCDPAFTISFTDGPNPTGLCPQELYSFAAIVTPTPGHVGSITLLGANNFDSTAPPFTPGFPLPPFFYGANSVPSGWATWMILPGEPGMPTGVEPDATIPGAYDIGSFYSVDYVPHTYKVYVKAFTSGNLIQNGTFAWEPVEPDNYYFCFTSAYQDYEGPGGNDPGHIKVGSFYGEGSPCIPYMAPPDYDCSRDVVTHSGDACTYPGISNELCVRGATGSGIIWTEWIAGIAVKHCEHCSWPGNYFWGQNVNFCAGAWYHMSYWVRLMEPCTDPTQLPIVEVDVSAANPSTDATTTSLLTIAATTILIDTVGTVTTPSSCDGTWYNVQYDFKAPLGGTVFFSMTDNNTNSYGNAFAIDDIELYHEDYDSATITIGPKPYVIPKFGRDGACSNAPVVFTGFGNTGDVLYYQIDDGSGSGWGPVESTTIITPGTFTIPSPTSPPLGPYPAGTVVKAKIVNYIIAGCPNVTDLTAYHIEEDVTVIQAPMAGALVPGTLTLCGTGATAVETDPTAGGAYATWTFSSSDPTIAAVDAAGLVTSGPGHPYMGCETATVTLDVSSVCGDAHTSAPVTVCNLSDDLSFSPNPTCPGATSTVTFFGSPGDIATWDTYDYGVSTTSPIISSGTYTFPPGPAGTAETFTSTLTPPIAFDHAGAEFTSVQVGSCIFHPHAAGLGVDPVPVAGTIVGPSVLCYGSTERYTYVPSGPWISGIFTDPTPAVTSGPYPYSTFDFQWYTGALPNTAGSVVYNEYNECGSAVTTFPVFVEDVNASMVVDYGGCDPLPGQTISLTFSGTVGDMMYYTVNGIDFYLILTSATMTVGITAVAPSTNIVFMYAFDPASSCNKVYNTVYNIDVPDPTVQIISAPSSVCPGQPFQIEFSGLQGSTITFRDALTTYSVTIPVTTSTEDRGTVWSPILGTSISEYLAVESITNGCWYIDGLYLYSYPIIDPPGSAPYVLPRTEVSLYPTPIISLIAAPPACGSDATFLYADCPTCTSYTWTDPTGTLYPSSPASATWYNTNITNDGISGIYTVTGYDINGCQSQATTNVVFYPPIIGNDNNCPGPNPMILSDAFPGGVWSSSDDAIASIDPSTGQVTFYGVGTATITYSVGGSCAATTTVINIPPDVTCYADQDMTTDRWHYGFINTSTETVTVKFTAELLEYTGGTMSAPTTSIFYSVPCISGGIILPPGTTEVTLSPISDFAYIGLTPPGSYSLFDPAGPYTYPSWQIDAIYLASITSGQCTWPVTCIGRSDRHSAPVTPGETTISNRAPITVIPNPNKGEFTLKGAVPATITSKEIYFEIIDMLGQVVYKDAATIENGGINKNITLGDNIASGVYLVKIKDGGVNQVIRFTLNR